VDSLTAFVALLMIGGANVLKNATWMDPVGGLVISLMVVQAGLGNTRSAILELCDIGIDDEIKAKVRRQTEGALTEIRSGMKGGDADVRQVQGIKAGQTYLVDVELGVPSSWTVAQTQKIEEAVRERIGGKVRGVKRVKVRFVPKEVAGEVDFMGEFIPMDVSPRSSPEPESEDEKEHEHHGHDHKH
jgi:divalent metal cation (Fe/Co/Zn/Cd) transporter